MEPMELSPTVDGKAVGGKSAMAAAAQPLLPNKSDDDDDDGPASFADAALPVTATAKKVDDHHKMRFFHHKHTELDPSHIGQLCHVCNAQLPPLASNYISTTKYSLLSFLPQNLFEQFQKKANFYFLVIAVLSCVPGLSPKTPLVTVPPLVVVLAVTAVKEAFEDYRRHRIDVAINSSLVRVWRPPFDAAQHHGSVGNAHAHGHSGGSSNGGWQDVAWRDVQCGDIVMVMNEQYFPADIVLLQSSSRQGMCNIETANLDGETNLKIKQAVAQTYGLTSAAKGSNGKSAAALNSVDASEDAPAAGGSDGLDFPHLFSGVLESEAPKETMDAHSWKGNLVALNGRADKVPLSMTQLLLRGCRLMHTKWVIGMVCFTGLETKLMLQNKQKELKRSNVDRTVDRALYMIFVFQGLLCVACAIGNAVWADAHARSHWYLGYGVSLGNQDKESALSFFTFLVLVDLLVPISLYVSMELVKFSQAWFIDQDVSMYYAKADVPAKARTSNLNEELGQVQYIFSDKTGTLTRNEMKWLRCTVGHTAYGPGEMRAAGNEKTRLPIAPGIPLLNPEYRFEDARLLHELVAPTTAPERRHAIDEYLTLLAVCHSVVPGFEGCDRDHVHALPESGCSARVKYQAASPDELALVEAAVDEQYYMHSRLPAKIHFRGREIQGNRLTVNIRGVQCQFEVFELLGFTSDRKRMSVVVFDHRDKQIKVYCKGADNVIRERAAAASLAATWSATEQHLKRFAAEGLRTLVCGYRVISGEEFDRWFDAHQSAKASMRNRAAEEQASAAAIERDLVLLGSTAIEDRLQEGVPEAIERLAQANIKIWVLTGDKVETAINIGRSARLLTPLMTDDNLIVMDIDEALPEHKAKVETFECLAAAERSVRRPGVELDDMGIVVSGRALSFIFPIRKLDKRKREIIPPLSVLNEELRIQMRFLEVCKSCKAVVCCRMSPKQKAQMVRLVKDHTDDITLAVGDGANDVAMIEAAHLGIGIEGLEGKQAVMASDYSIGQFRFLTPLLLVHGAWNYRRLSLLILYSFYKNITISLTQIFFAFYSGFSAQVFFDALCGSLFNLIFTAMPVLLAAVFNRDVQRDVMLTYPLLYSTGQKRLAFRVTDMFGVVAKATVDACILYWFSTGVFFRGASTVRDGFDNDLWNGSTAMFTAMIVVAQSKIALETTTWTWLNALWWSLSVVSWFLWLAVYSSLLTASSNPEMYAIFGRLMGMPAFWLYVLVASACCLLPEIAWKYVRVNYNPSITDLGAYHIDHLNGLQRREKEVNEQKLRDRTAEAKAKAEAAAKRKSTAIFTGAAGAGSAAEAGADAAVSVGSAGAKRPAELRRQSTWQRAQQDTNESHGYVQFLEGDRDPTFVMSQPKYLALKLAGVVPQRVDIASGASAAPGDTAADVKDDSKR